MAVLNKGGGEEHGKGDQTLRIEHDKNEMRPGFRNHADQGSYQQNPGHVVPDEPLQFPKRQTRLHKEQGTKGPEKNPQNMSLYDVVPNMRVEIVFRRNHRDVKRAKCQGRERDSLPVPRGRSQDARRHEKEKGQDESDQQEAGE